MLNQKYKPDRSRPDRQPVTSDRKPTKNRLWQSLATRSSAIHPKLNVSEANDPQEREADQIAERVTRIPPAGSAPSDSINSRRAKNPAFVLPHKKSLQVQQPTKEDSTASVPAIVHDTINSPGQPLDQVTRSFMEERLNNDFGQVRVHTDTRAAESARAMDAEAYTVGSDIVFGASRSPSDASGRKLLAHELTHVVQQRQAPALHRMMLQRKVAAIRFQDEPTLEEVSDGKKVLQQGDKGESVIRITTALSELGHYTHSVINEDFDLLVKIATSKYQDAKGLKGKAADGRIDKLTFDQLDMDFSSSYQVERDLIRKQTSADILKGTQFVNATEQAAAERAISTEVRVDPVTGKLPDFKKEIIGKGTYEDRLRKIVDAKIVALYNYYGKGKAVEHATSSNLYDWKQIEVIAAESQIAVDKVFGEYTKGLAPAALKQGVNIFDAWTDKEKQFTAGGKSYEDEKVAWRVDKIFTGDEAVAALDLEHGAIQERADEKAIVDKIRTEMITKYRAELIETHKGWPGYEDEGKVYIQLFKAADDDKKKKDMWGYFQTFIHEYLHALEHADHIKYRDPMSEQKGDKTLREGMADYFTKIVWNSITIDDALRAKIEGALNDPLKKAPIPPLNTYHESANAERLAGIVGVRNVAAAFFLGKVDLVGGP